MAHIPLLYMDKKNHFWNEIPTTNFTYLHPAQNFVTFWAWLAFAFCILVLWHLQFVIFHLVPIAWMRGGKNLAIQGGGKSELNLYITISFRLLALYDDVWDKQKIKKIFLLLTQQDISWEITMFRNEQNCVFSTSEHLGNSQLMGYASF